MPIYGGESVMGGGGSAGVIHKAARGWSWVQRLGGSPPHVSDPAPPVAHDKPSASAEGGHTRTRRRSSASATKSALAALAVAALEAIDAAPGVYQLLLARVERVALAAALGGGVRPVGPGVERVPAGQGTGGFTVSS